MGTQVGTAEEQIESRRGGGNAGTGESWERRVYRVYWSDNTANSIDIRNASGVPGWGAPLTTYPTAGYALLAMEKNANPMAGNQSIWEVEVIYRLPTATENVPQPNATIHKWQTLISISPYPTEIPIQKDRDGKVIINILGEAITEPQPTKVIYDEQLSIRFLTDRLDRSHIDTCKGSVNDGALILTIAGATVNYAAGTLLFNGWPAQEQYDQDGNKIASVEYQFLYRAEGWNPLRFESFSVKELATGGVLYMGGTNNKYSTDYNNDGEAVPHPLNASGHRAVAGDLIAVSTYNGYTATSFLLLLDGLYS